MPKTRVKSNAPLTVERKLSRGPLRARRVRASSGWLSTRARTDLAYVRVYSLHVLQKRIQGLVRRVRQGDQLKIEQLETVRQAMLTLWHDAHQYTPSGVPLSYEQFEMQKK